MNKAIQNIVILGGGTAGWMSACLLEHHLAGQGFSISVIESPNIPTVGVGEGSTPQLRQFFQTLGISEHDWMPCCDATYKLGIRFNHWTGDPNYPEYFHPFPSLPDKHTAKEWLKNCYLRRQGKFTVTHPDSYFLSAYLAHQAVSPISLDGKNLGLNYSYHFDSAKLGKYLTGLAVKRGVTHIQATAEDVRLTPSGDIQSIILDGGQVLEGNMFIDCSGFQSLLLQKTFKVPFVSYQNSLFNDKAIAIATPVEPSINAMTTSTALENGWAWHIPLTSRVGNGYVYSSQFCEPEQAEKELRCHLKLSDEQGDARHLSMKIGRVEQHWAKNCLAVGLSQGFIEPLEATALHLVQETVENFVSAFKAGGFTTKHQSEFNQRINARFDGIKDYIVCHFKVNTRDDSEYWRANRANTQISDSLAMILDCWDKGGDITQEIERQNIAAYYPSVSWNCLLAGYGRFPNVTNNASTHHNTAAATDKKIQMLLGQYAQLFCTHSTALKRLVTRNYNSLA